MAKKRKIKKQNLSKVEKEYYENFKLIDRITGKIIIKKIKITRYEKREINSDVDENKDDMIENINNKVNNTKPSLPDN
jgi:hypothetical protein